MWVKLARAYATFNRLTVQQIRESGLTQPQFGALECLGHLGAMPIGELSRKMLVSGGNMTCVVDNLEKAGLVERVQSGNDRRSVTVRLTTKGQRLFQSIFPPHAAYIADLAATLSHKEQEELARLLKKLGLGLAPHP
ncbi:MAG: MarR family transcriptional regulator [Ignavibacteriae bacterium]|nr:MarR family transcriptional regulator [Ignavibacteriota bacterium]